MNPVSVEEYLHTSHEPSCEYVEGVLFPKAMGSRKHGKTQSRLIDLVERAFPQFEGIPELTVRITATHWLIPDLVVDYRDRAQDPYPISPVHLCIEILSPDDRLNKTLSKCETYHAWGTPHTWIIDPEALRAWQYSKGSQPVEIDPTSGELCAGDIHIRLSEIFSAL